MVFDPALLETRFKGQCVPLPSLHPSLGWAILRGFNKKIPASPASPASATPLPCGHSAPLPRWQRAHQEDSSWDSWDVHQMEGGGQIYSGSWCYHVHDWFLRQCFFTVVFLVIEVRGGTWFRTPCPIVVRSR